MKNPNGYGSITKLKRKNLRKPYNVRITVEVKNGKQVRKSLGYFSSKQEALKVLSEYQNNKENTDISLKTFDELWQDWIRIKDIDENLADSTRRGYHFTYVMIPDYIKSKTFTKLNFKDWQDLFIELKEKFEYNTLRSIRSAISQLYDYAINNEIVAVNYIRNINIGSSKKQEVLIFTDEQIKQIYDACLNAKDERIKFTAEIMIMLIYNGCRISELLNLKQKDVHITERYFEIKKAKTAAGIRTVPIHEEIKWIYEKHFNIKYDYLLKERRELYNTQILYDHFRNAYWCNFIKLYGWDKNLTPHNTRKTFSSLLKRFNADATYQKLILGHEGALTLTEKVYTKVDTQKLIDTVNLIPAPFNL